MAKKSATSSLSLKTEMVSVIALKPHPRNYKQHPDEQIEHLMKSIAEHGFYRNVVIAKDNTILAGHGVVQAVERMGLLGPAEVPVIRMDLDPDDPRALKIMASDNEVGKLAETDDRMLTALLRDVMTADDLLGTGFDAQSLSALVYVSRPIEEVHTKEIASEWVGMPEFDPGKPSARLSIQFRSLEDRDSFVQQTGLVIRTKFKAVASPVWSCWWPAGPETERMDRQEVLFTDDFDDEEGK